MADRNAERERELAGRVRGVKMDLARKLLDHLARKLLDQLAELELSKELAQLFAYTILSRPRRLLDRARPPAALHRR